MKVFISLPHTGKSDEQIKKEMDFAIEQIKQDYPCAEMIDSFITDSYIEACENAGTNLNIGLWYLGKSIELLSQAKLAVFVNDWQEARGCIIEHQAATAYGIPVLQINTP